MFFFSGIKFDFNFFDIIFLFLFLNIICGLFFFLLGWYIKLLLSDIIFEVNFVCIKIFCNELYGYVFFIGVDMLIFKILW